MKPQEYSVELSKLLNKAVQTVPIELIVGMTHVSLTDLTVMHIHNMRLMQSEQLAKQMTPKIIAPNSN
jgi:hypothetical protein